MQTFSVLNNAIRIKQSNAMVKCHNVIFSALAGCYCEEIIEMCVVPEVLDGHVVKSDLIKPKIIYIKC